MYYSTAGPFGKREEYDHAKVKLLQVKDDLRSDRRHGAPGLFDVDCVLIFYVYKVLVGKF